MLSLFKYVGRDQKGHKIKGEIKANNTNEVVSYLAKNRIIPIVIQKNEEKYKKIWQIIKNVLQRDKIPLPELLNFCREMAALNGVGISLLDAIKQLSMSSSSTLLTEVLADIGEHLIAGKTLANSLRKYPKIFNPIFTNIIEVGENTGNLTESFVQLASYLEGMINNHRRIASTTRYPLIVFFAVIAAAITINIMVVPKFAQIFKQYGGELPFPTRILIAFSDFILNHWQLLIIIALAIIVSIPSLFKKPKVRYYWDKYKLKFPVFGNLQKRIIISQFTWTFSLVFRSGIEVIKGINLAGNSAGNAYFTQQISLMREGLERGESLSIAASNVGIFPPSILQMFSVGEESGKLDDILQAVNVYYEREIDYDIKRINELIEPLLLVVVGIIVLVLALGVYLPMWDLVRIAKFG